jgi:hypothetical protein
MAAARPGFHGGINASSIPDMKPAIPQDPCS